MKKLTTILGSRHFCSSFRRTKRRRKAHNNAAAAEFVFVFIDVQGKGSLHRAASRDDEIPQRKRQET